jgi:MoaA/NifB/PqqE/SkfB family radical SAM enzyme
MTGALSEMRRVLQPSGRILAHRALNYMLAERRFREKAVVLDSYPYHAFIDPSTICNLHCPFCAVGKGSTDHPKYLMRFDEFKRIMDMLGDYLFQVEIYQYGEPLLNPDVFRMIEYAKRKYYAFTRISTNLNIFNKEKAERLVASGLDYLTLSIDGASQETYSKYRVGGDFNKVLENVTLIVAAKKAH